MKVSELMTDVTPSATYSGFASNDDFVLGVDTEGTATSEKDYAVVAVGITNCESSINSDTNDTQYIRTGKITTKTSAQRAFKIEGERYIGDIFQDWVLSHATEFGKGADVERKYVYFNTLTGKGEKGTLSFVPSDTQTGDPSARAGFSVDATSVGKVEEYTYTAAA